jgi:hypothetical protein
MNRRGPVLATGVEQLGLRSVRRVADTYARRRTAGAGGRAHRTDARRERRVPLAIARPARPN